MVCFFISQQVLFFMTAKITSETHFTGQVKTLLSKLYGRSVLKDSLLERAISFYEKQPASLQKIDKFKLKISELSAQKDDGKVKRKIELIEREFRDYKQELKFESNERFKFLSVLCKEIIDLCEGTSLIESNRKSAQLLGTIQLLSPTEGKNIAEGNERSKPLYKAILCLRLLDQLCMDTANIVAEPHIKDYAESIREEYFKNYLSAGKEIHKAYVDQVKIPIIMAALLQDIGHFHPEAQQVVCGSDGTLNPFRMLELEDRKKLLQINYRETIKFLVEGVGAPIYVGNSKTNRDKFNIAEHKKLVFIKHLLKTSINPKQGIGNLLKVPQIYTSIILSTKESYDYKLLPKVYQALNQNAERGTCSQVVVDTLHKITGDFPQGFGIIYIPEDDEGEPTDRYEYAIVNQLYPEEVDQPTCRTATRNLTFISHGQDFIVKPSFNLHNTATAKAFATLSKERLNEILELLSSNYQERKKLDLLPRCWHANDYFSMKDNQKLWNKQS